jgi:aquaporin Z
VRGADVVGYIAAQCLGAIGGTWLAASALGMAAAHPSVNFVLTLPGPAGVVPAVAGELAISFLTLAILLAVSGRPATARATGVVAGVVVMLNIVIEAPLSGMSMNPARSLGPALVAGDFSSFWIYLVVPPAGMQLAAALHRALSTPGCAKLHHPASVRCLFCGA